MSVVLFFDKQVTGSIYLDLGISNTKNIINKYKMLMDTGASMTTVNFKILNAMGYTKNNLMNEPSIGITANDAKVQVFPVIIPSISIGDVTINNFPIFTSLSLNLSNLLGTDI